MVMFGTSETIVSLAKEALERGHQVTVVLPDNKEFNLNYSNLKIVNGDMKSKEDVVRHSKGNDVVICVYDPSSFWEHAGTTRVIIDGLKDAGVNHLVYATHTHQLMYKRKQSNEEAQKPEHSAFYEEIDSQQLPEFKSAENIHWEAIKILQGEKGLNWGYVYAGKSGNTSDAESEKEILYSHLDGETILHPKNYISSNIS